MAHEQPDDLTAEERRALQQLPREGTPSRLLEERTVTALRAAGLLRRPARGRRWVVIGGALAASLALFVAGFTLGRRSSRSAATTIDATATPVVHHVAWY